MWIFVGWKEKIYVLKKWNIWFFKCCLKVVYKIFMRECGYIKVLWCVMNVINILSNFYFVW